MKKIRAKVIEYQAFDKEELVRQAKKQELENRVEKFYKELESFAKDENHSSFLGFKSKERLRVKNYVGLIETKSGVLEIYPKVVLENKNDNSSLKNSKAENLKNHAQQELQEKLKEAYKIEYLNDTQNLKPSFDKIPTNKFQSTNPKLLLIELLRTLKNSPFKESRLSSLKSEKMPLFDIFISMFLQELEMIFKKGFKRDYVSIEENRTFLKGKLLFAQNLRYNFIHKERFFTQSDEFILNNPANRLIKSTLALLKTKTKNYESDIKNFLERLECVEFSKNFKKDFLQCQQTRHYDYYKNLLSWCQLFLKGKTFTPYQGEDKAYALLFPMEKLFEDYVAAMFKRSNPKRSNPALKIKPQVRRKNMLIDVNDDKQEDGKQGLFPLKPDLLIKKNHKKIIADTKWKIPNNDEKFGISQSDLYQVFAYAKFYGAKEVWLIYPFCERTKDLKEKISQKEWVFNEAQETCKQAENSQDVNKNPNIHLKVYFAPLPSKAFLQDSSNLKSNN